MKPTKVLEILKVVTWVVFIGLCIRTGAMVFSFFISLFVNSGASKNLYPGYDLSELQAFSLWHYIVMSAMVIILSGLKAHLFFRIIKIISLINITNPFSEQVGKLISKLSSIAFDIAITAFVANTYAKWLLKQQLYFTFDADPGAYLVLAGVLFVIAQIFKKGIELQSENELTV